MTKERILIMIEKLLKIYEEMEDDEIEIEDNNLVELMGIDEDDNGIYKFKN